MPSYLVAVQADHAPSAQTLYLLGGAQLDDATVALLSDALLHDWVVQRISWQQVDALGGDPFVPITTGCVLEVAYRPGVTDNEAESLLEGAHLLGVTALEQAHTLRRYLLAAAPESETAQQSARDLANDLIQTTLRYRPIDDPARRAVFYSHLLAAPVATPLHVANVPLRGADDEELLRISKEGILALDLEEMRAVRDYFAALGRDPSDGELETIAQTWSEHCSHKTFKARVRYRTRDEGRGTRDEGPQTADRGPGTGDWGPGTGDWGTRTAERKPEIEDGGQQAGAPPLYSAYRMLQSDCEIDSIIKTFLMTATQEVLQAHEQSVPKSKTQHPTSNIQHPTSPWVLSAFVDNAGIIAFGDEHEISFKVETHNHPSALEPFGGANTGVGGVVRDVLGVSGRPIANTDVLCFGPPGLAPDALPEGVLPPERIAAGVVAGVRDYGNKLGIPTVNGAVLYEPGYIANPLVFCGTLGIAPRGSNPHRVQPGDAVVLLGGRTGRDGIHGATFSSEELTHTTAATVGSAVQIGDPITEKKLLDVLLQARDRGLYSGITDCGAGGLSSAVGELGAATGVSVDLATVPLKYLGLQPWEIWLSEAQERMVLAVPQEQLDAFLALCASEDVEATAIGHFSDDRTLRVCHGDRTLVELDMAFLHNGRPQRVLEALWDRGQGTGDRGQGDGSQSPIPNPQSPAHLLLALLSHPNIASKERIVRTYDHEVGGGTVVKPLVGVAGDGPGDAAVLQPLRTSVEGVALGCGINARYGLIDPYWMALACVDEALRNVVAVGGDPQRTAILDNFCWGDPREPDRMAGLVRAAAGCYDAAVAFGTPFISGKDSLNNEWRLPNGERRPIPPTLLISALAHLPDVTRAVTMDVKEAGDYIYLLGETRDELGGSHIADCRLQIAELDEQLQSTISNLQSAIPKVDLALAPRLFAALHEAMQAGLVRACHDLSEGGLAVAAAEMALAGGLGVEIDLGAVGLQNAPNTAEEAQLIKLFSESPTRLLIEVRRDDAPAVEAVLAGLPLARIGSVTDAPLLAVAEGGCALLRATLAALRTAFEGTV